MGPGWTKELVDQLDWHWRTSLRPRLDGLTDEEYLDEPSTTVPRSPCSATCTGCGADSRRELSGPAATMVGCTCP